MPFQAPDGTWWSDSMPFQSPDGTWWSDDRKYYRSGDQWLLYTPGTRTSSQQSEAAQKNAERQPSTLAAALEAFGQCSTEPYRQQPQLVFGTNRQTPGKPAVPAITLDPSFRAAASEDRMIWGFVQAMDKMASGQV